MARRPKFNVHEVFQYLDVFEQNTLTKECLKRVLVDNKVYPSEAELGYLYDRFDRNRNGRINYEEFTEEIMPKHSFH